MSESYPQARYYKKDGAWTVAIIERPGAPYLCSWTRWTRWGAKRKAHRELARWKARGEQPRFYVVS